LSDEEKNPSDQLPEAHFEGNGQLPDWRIEDPDDDPDDEEIKTPEDVVMMLGFDPAKESSEK
jgi:hypothetical protein